MYTFLASFFVHEAAQGLRRAAGRVGETLPTGSVKTRCELRALDEVSGGWLVFRPESAEHRPRISEWVTPACASLVVGTTTTRSLPARAVLESFENGGLDEVRRMEGNFSAIIVDLRGRELFVCSDAIGTRTLRYVDGPGGVFVAMHDAVLVAAGAVTPDVDDVSVASGVLCGWSLGGRPLLSRCEVIGPDYYLRGNRERRELIRDSFLDEVSRLARADETGIARVDEELSQTLVSTLRQNLEIEEPAEVRLALTAGVDTRAALALLRATHPKQRLVATTTGAADSTDVQCARRICRVLGIAHEVIEPGAPTHQSFATNLELLAYVTNGDTDGKRALSGAQTTAPGALLLSGLGGEIFRGYYYPYARRRYVTGNLPKASAESVKSLLLPRAFGYFETLELHDKLKRKVEDRFLEALQAFDAYAKDVYAYMDCFYLRERYGVWGALNSRRIWVHSLAPFHSVSAIRLVSRLPVPWGDQRIQAKLIRAHLPLRLYWTPVNGAELLTLHGRGALKFWLRDGARRASVAHERIFSRRKSRKTHERIRAELLATDVYDFLYESLTQSGSLALRVMPKGVLQRLLEEHRKKVSNAKPLGYLATLEAWRKIVDEARAARASKAVMVQEL